MAGSLCSIIPPAQPGSIVGAVIEITGQVVVVGAQIYYPPASRAIDDEAACIRLGVRQNVFWA